MYPRDAPSGLGKPEPWGTRFLISATSAGMPWRDIPERFGDGTKVLLRFSRLGQQRCVWERVFQHLAAGADNEYAMIDSTVVRAYQHRLRAISWLPSNSSPASSGSIDDRP
jgi:transposase